MFLGEDGRIREIARENKDLEQARREEREKEEKERERERRGHASTRRSPAAVAACEERKEERRRDVVDQRGQCRSTGGLASPDLEAPRRHGGSDHADERANLRADDLHRAVFHGERQRYQR